MARKILLADDSVTAQNMGRKILADAGYEVITVNNGSAALKKIAEQKPDLIVLDVYMPGYSGLEVCQRLKEAQETSRVPVLLTVGKLEPFKPEEAKRVRADGFIVKPFEASELLSALSKLEDKIVPRAEASKPGRFARATAALDEGRYDKSVAMDEDSGWKNRIAFPSKKKEKPEQDEAEDTPIYNAMNKDLRTVVDRKVAEQPRDVRAEEPRVDLGALAPEGLPKDVTPEEIAALAAAAAQVKGKIAESYSAEPGPTEDRAEQAKTEQARTEPAKIEEAKATLSAEAVAETPAAATFAEQTSEEKPREEIEAPAAKSSDAPKDVVPSPADVMAAIAGLEPDGVTAPAAGSGNGSWHGVDRRIADEPVTMAVAAGAESVAARSSWTAVSVALAPEETAISLELEMQKAYAAFAAAETGHSEVIAAPQDTKPAPSEPASLAESAVVSVLAPEASVAVPATPAPEPAPVQRVEAAIPLLSEASKTIEASVESNPMPAAEAEPETSKLETKVETPTQNATEVRNEASTVVALAAEEASAPPTQVSESTIPAFVNAFAVEETSASQPSASQASLDPPAVVPGEPAARVTGDLAKKESEIAANTAAAWASWRRIRESGAPVAAVEPFQKEVEESASDPKEEAAMAVAAGAEKAPEEVPATSESSEEGIASIVDSVLAEMRPKIYEEISRKMKKK